MINKSFKNFAVGAALMLTTAFSTPAMAGKDFVKQDLRNEETIVVQLLGQRLSSDKLTFVVHGGNKNLMMAAYRVAQRLDDEGVPVAFLLGPASGDILNIMQVDFYTKGGKQYGYAAVDNENNTIAENEAGMYEQAIKAYNKDFGQTASIDSFKTENPVATLAAN